MTSFYDLFNPPDTGRGNHPVPSNVTPLDPARATRYAHKALTSECENVASAPEGTRNHTLNRAAFSLGQLVAAGHLTRDDTWTALATAARAAGLDPHEIDATLRSGLGAGEQQPRVVPDQQPLDAPAVTLLLVDQPTEPTERTAPAGDADSAREAPETASWAP